MNDLNQTSRRHFLSDAWLHAGAAGVAVGALSHALPGYAAEGQANRRRKPHVSVTLDGPDDGGDFGPHTSGTKTGGIQEALDYAQANSRDVYIHGGGGGLHKGEGIPHNVYLLHE